MEKLYVFGVKKKVYFTDEVMRIGKSDTQHTRSYHSTKMAVKNCQIVTSKHAVHAGQMIIC